MAYFESILGIIMTVTANNCVQICKQLAYSLRVSDEMPETKVGESVCTHCTYHLLMQHLYF